MTEQTIWAVREHVIFPITSDERARSYLDHFFFIKEDALNYASQQNAIWGLQQDSDAESYHYTVEAIKVR